jgi:cytochrome c-type biogenesis protein
MSIIAATLSPAERRARVALVGAATLLFSVFVLGLAVLATSPLEAGSLTLAYTSGLSMIVLPCTLPAVLVIVPLALGRTYRRGVAMAALFGLGLTLTIGGYGLAVAWLGQILYLDTVTLLMWLTAAVAAYLFGLSELGLVRWRPPAYGAAVPGVIERRGDLARAFGMGLLLGNAGIGCPNPAFYVLLTFIAGSGDPVTGAVYGLVHGVGRATPLLALAILAVVGVNATGWLLTRRERIERLVGWGLVGFGAFLIPKGYLFKHAFWEESVFHKVWNGLVHLALGPNVAESAEVERLLGDLPLHDPGSLYGPWAIIGLLLALPILWGDARRLGARRPLAAARAVAVVVLGLAWLWPAPALAHGDDTVTLGSFVGPLVGLTVLFATVGLGRLVLRALGGGGPRT